MKKIKLPPEHIFQKEDDHNCGPSCLVMVYRLLGKNISLKKILTDFRFERKGEATFPAQLARHLTKNGIKNKIYISNPQVIPPAWKDLPKEELVENIKTWLTLNISYEDIWSKYALHLLFYLQEGGEVILKSYNANDLKEMLDRKSLIIATIDEVWLWGHRIRTKGHKGIIDNFRAKTTGHFVLVKGHKGNKFQILDPYPTNIAGRYGSYEVEENQLINASLTWAATIIEVLKG